MKFYRLRGKNRPTSTRPGEKIWIYQNDHREISWSKKYSAESNYENLAAKRASEKKDWARLVQKDYSSEDEKRADRAKYFKYTKMTSAKYYDWKSTLRDQIVKVYPLKWLRQVGKPR